MVAIGNFLRSHEGVDTTGWGATFVRDLRNGTSGDAVGHRRTSARGRDRDGEGGLPALIPRGNRRDGRDVWWGRRLQGDAVGGLGSGRWMGGGAARRG